MSNTQPLILITGASGFVGSHTVAAFLTHGYRVRVTGRNKSSCDRMLKVHHDNQCLEGELVPDITEAGAFDQAVMGVDGVIYMASPFKYNIKDNEKDLILPALDGTKRILESIVAHAPKVKRVVLTSSFAAVADFSKGLWPGHVYDESEWNPMTYQEAKDDRKGRAYAGSKKLAEEAAWEFVKDPSKNVSFTLATINPPMIYGPSVSGSVDINHLGQSPSEIYALMNGSLKEAPPTTMPVFADVRDVAEAHRLAYETDKPGRFLIANGPFTKPQVCRLFIEQIPAIKSRVPTPSTDGAPPSYSIDTTKARVVLGMKFRSLPETFLDMARAFLELEDSAKM